MVDSGTSRGGTRSTASRPDRRRSQASTWPSPAACGLNADFRYIASGRRSWTRRRHLCAEILKEFPRAVFFLGKLIFAKEQLYYRLLHNETAFAIQRRLQFAGMQTVVLPIRVQTELLM